MPTYDENVILDDGSADSPELQLVGGSNDDTVKIYLDDDATAGYSDGVIMLCDAGGNSRLEIRDSSNNKWFYVDSLGNLTLAGTTGVIDSPELRFAAGQGGDVARIWLDASPTSGYSDLTLKLCGTGGNSRLQILNSADTLVAWIADTGAAYLGGNTTVSGSLSVSSGLSASGSITSGYDVIAGRHVQAGGNVIVSDNYVGAGDSSERVSFSSTYGNVSVLNANFGVGVQAFAQFKAIVYGEGPWREHSALAIQRHVDDDMGATLYLRTFYGASGTSSADDEIALIRIESEDSDRQIQDFAYIRCWIESPTYGSHSARLNFYVANNGAMAERARVHPTGFRVLGTLDVTGNTGIGTSAPSGRLHVEDTTNVLVRVKAANGYAGIYLHDYGAAQLGYLDFRQGSDVLNGRIAQYSTGNANAGLFSIENRVEGAAMRFMTTPSGGSLTERMRLTSTGYLGIGCTPSMGFQVVGTDYASSVSGFYRVYNSNSGPEFRFVHSRGSGVAGQDSDTLASVVFYGYNDAGTPEQIAYGMMQSQIIDASDGTEDGQLLFRNYDAGSLQTTFIVRGDGIYLPALPTESLEVMDAGSAGASAQDWVTVKVGGNTGYLRVYSSK